LYEDRILFTFSIQWRSFCPTRKAFADYIARIYLKYRNDPSADDEGVDLCLQQTSSQRLLVNSCLTRNLCATTFFESPYRGLLVYHGLGSGKTVRRSALPIPLVHQESVYSTPASLQSNFRQEIRKCGDPIYTQNNFWETRTLRSEADKQPALAMGISDEFLKSQGRYFVTVPNQPSNYNTLPLDTRKGIDAQIEDLIDSRYNFINYNGLNGTSVKALIPKTTRKSPRHLTTV